MRFVLQAVGRHIGKGCKIGVYRAIRAEQTICFQEKQNSGDANATISPLSSQDKMIIICTHMRNLQVLGHSTVNSLQQKHGYQLLI